MRREYPGNPNKFRSIWEHFATLCPVQTSKDDKTDEVSIHKYKASRRKKKCGKRPSAYIITMQK